MVKNCYVYEQLYGYGFTPNEISIIKRKIMPTDDMSEDEFRNRARRLGFSNVESRIAYKALYKDEIKSLEI